MHIDLRISIFILSSCWMVMAACSCDDDDDQKKPDSSISKSDSGKVDSSLREGGTDSGGQPVNRDAATTDANRDSAQQKDANETDDDDAGNESECPNADYECLREMPNTSARVCPDLRVYDPRAERAFSPCEESICPNAHCVSGSIITPPESKEQFYECDMPEMSVTYYCVPDFLIQTVGGVQWRKCRSISNMEGVCIPSCLKTVRERSETADLPQDNCLEGEICIPCFDGATGEPSPGACENISNYACNKEPEEEPVTWDKCCYERGSCIPDVADLIDDKRAADFGKDSCAGDNELCIPDVVSKVMPPICTTASDAVGRCLPDCMDIVKQASPAFGKGNCSAAEDRCVPCELDDQDTGVCTYVRGDSTDRTE